MTDKPGAPRHPADTPDRTRRGLLGGGLLLGGAALAAGSDRTAAAAPPADSVQPGRDADAGRLTEHRQTYYRMARF